MKNMKFSLSTIMYLVLFWGLSVVFLIMVLIGSYTFVRDRSFLKGAVLTTATVSEKFNRPNPNGDSEPLWFMTYEFVLPDNRVVSKQEEISYFEYSNIYEPGTRIELHYNPADPDNHIFDTNRAFKNRLNSIYILLGLTIACFIGGGIILALEKMNHRLRDKPDTLDQLFDEAQAAAVNLDYETTRQLLQKLLNQGQGMDSIRANCSS